MSNQKKKLARKIADTTTWVAKNTICDITSYHYSYVELIGGFRYSDSDYLQ